MTSAPTLIFTEAEWSAVIKDVVTRMTEEVIPHVTPISQELEHSYGEHWGSGSYCEFGGQRYLLTNEHVAAKIGTQRLAHKFYGDENYLRFRHEFHVYGAPNDTALVRIDEREWTRFPHGAVAIPAERFAPVHAPVEGELLFLVGFSGERSKFVFGTLATTGTPYLARECELPPDSRCDPQVHFGLHYNPALAAPVESKGRPLPLPPGMSGSVIWNTRVVEQRMRQQPWSPADAAVTGIVWGWPSDTCLVATKVEYMMLLQLL